MVKSIDPSDKNLEEKPKKPSVSKKQPTESKSSEVSKPVVSRKRKTAIKPDIEDEKKILEEVNDLNALDELHFLDEFQAMQPAELDDEKDPKFLDEEDGYYDERISQDLLTQIAGVYHIWLNWAHFELSIVNPTFDPLIPPVILPPEILPGSDEVEFVYTIHDHGFKLTTSKGEEMFTAGTSMCKFYYTIEKMIYLLIERLKQGGISTETEVQIAFDGHDLAQRKAFESVINLSYNVVVTNFDPGSWGERYLEVVKRLADGGYGYPQEAPRSNFRHGHHTTPGAKR